MANNLDLLFPGMEIEACSMFRVTRNAVTERDEEEAEDLLEMIEIELRERRFAPVVRLQVDKTMQPMLRGRLAAELWLDEQADVFVTVRTAPELENFRCNLRAPILISAGKGHQVINEADEAPVRAPLFEALATADATAA
jgi:polyphosphate kinase